MKSKIDLYKLYDMTTTCELCDNRADVVFENPEARKSIYICKTCCKTLLRRFIDVVDVVNVVDPY